MSRQERVALPCLDVTHYVAVFFVVLVIPFESQAYQLKVLD
jgi:hypothetical protein